MFNRDGVQVRAIGVLHATMIDSAFQPDSR